MPTDDAPTLAAAAETAVRADALFALARQRRVLMGIVNVTPDSFSDGGLFLAPTAAIAHAGVLADEGADILDIGAESTRPGHQPVEADEEWRRLADALPAIVAATRVPVSVDTSKAPVAARALAAGAVLVNDVWGFQRDPRMAGVVAAAGAGAVIMHNRMTRDPAIDIVADMIGFFERSLALAESAGVPPSRLMLDPGVGFGKTRDQNLAALRAVPVLVRTFGLPILVGVSRKSLWGDLLAAPTADRLVPTLAANIATAAFGARAFRVHDVRAHRDALTVLDALGL